MIIIQKFEHISIERLNELHVVNNCNNCRYLESNKCKVHHYRIDKKTPIECNAHKKEIL